ncbi:TonB-dependent receptor [Lacibacter luteus]|uniref:TonB-dependent receptor n=1 Tax=Lacibacter luteus TaxID=2508719 RepID=A0A4Q1CHI2_9BACT|nr:TonB-dependent receptor [Lacibacter luteus]RXK59720.1 TonB-dependent receptor [Lacibacter luteus]
MKKNFLVVAAGLFFSSQLNAQDTTAKSLGEVFVTANRIAQKQRATGKVIAIIDQATIQRNAGRTVSEIINQQASVFINGANNTLGTNQDIYFRGATSGNVLILIDGVPVGDASQSNNAFDLNHISTGMVERIEILKGAQSTLWGSDAVAGVINIITKKGGSKKAEVNGLLSYGSYNTLRANAGVGGKLNAFSYNLNYNFTDSKGFSAAQDTTGTKNFDKDGFKQNNFVANLRYDFNKHFAVKGFSNFGQYKNGIDAGAYADDADNNVTQKNRNNGLSFLYQGNKLNLTLSQNLLNNTRLYVDDSASVGGFAKYSKGSYEGNSSITELFGSYRFIDQLSLVAGLQNIAQNTTQSYKSISVFGPYETALGDSAKANNFSFYASLLATELAGFNMEAGFRVNSHSIYGTNATYTFNPSYNIDNKTRVFVNISSGYKIPSLYQLYSEYGNKELKPEATQNYEVGVQSFSADRKNAIRFVAFKRDIKNLIIFYTSPSWESYYINRDEQHDYGFEVESSIGLGKIGTWTNNFTYIDGEGKNNNVKVKNLYRRPNFSFNSVLTLEPVKGLTLMPSFRFISSRLKGAYDPGPAQMPSYYTIDFYTGYQATKNLRLFVDLRNITDQVYYDVPGYNSRKFNVTGGVSFQF